MAPPGVEGLVTGIEVTQKQLPVIEVDADRELDVKELPSLVLVSEGRAVGRLDGRQIDELLGSHMAS